MKLEDLARELAAELWTELRYRGHGNREDIQAAAEKIIAGFRQVAREERERCCKALCVSCRAGAALVGNEHSNTFSGHKWKCLAAAIRSLPEAPAQPEQSAREYRRTHPLDRIGGPLFMWTDEQVAAYAASETSALRAENEQLKKLLVPKQRDFKVSGLTVLDTLKTQREWRIFGEKQKAENERLQGLLDDEVSADKQVQEIVQKYMDDAERLQAQLAQMREALQVIDDHIENSALSKASERIMSALVLTVSSQQWLEQKLREAKVEALRDVADYWQHEGDPELTVVEWLRARAATVEAGSPKKAADGAY